MAANNFNNWDNGFPFQFIDSTSGGAPAVQKVWGFIIG